MLVLSQIGIIKTTCDLFLLFGAVFFQHGCYSSLTSSAKVKDSNLGRTCLASLDSMNVGNLCNSESEPEVNMPS